MKHRIAAAVSLTVLVAASAAAAACESGVAADPTPVQTWKITPAAGGTSTPRPQVTSTAMPAGTPAAGNEFTIRGISNEFDVEEITAPAGAITIIFDNRDGGVVHNIHFFEGTDDEGADAGETALEPGPVVQTLPLDLEPGEYYYQCDAHPTTMTGTLTVLP